MEGRNKLGTGGFGDHPENINKEGAPPKDKSIQHIIRNIGDSDRVEVDVEISTWKNGEKKTIRKHNEIKSTDGRKIKQMLHSNAYIKAFEDIRWYKEVMDREHGKSVQPLIHAGAVEIDHFFNILTEVDNEIDEQERDSETMEE